MGILFLQACTPRLGILDDFEREFYDVNNPCPEGKECYKFPDESTPICWSEDPCEVCPSKKCVVMMSYPGQVRCE